MDDLVFITGNQDKANYVSKYFGRPIKHVKVDVTEIQSLDLHEIVRHKVREAYNIVKQPVMVEDVSLEFTALGGLPGPFIKFFLAALGLEGTAELVDGKDRSAVARCVIGYYDGADEQYFEGSADGRIAERPREGRGFGFDPLFINDGYDVPRSEMSEEDHDRTYSEIKLFGKLKEYLENKRAA
jgi:non-canonical purine NTP pyrophosphatase (RdgB/HAM1 family)